MLKIFKDGWSMDQREKKVFIIRKRLWKKNERHQYGKKPYKMD